MPSILALLMTGAGIEGKDNHINRMRYKKGSFVVVPNLNSLKGQKPDVQCVYVWLCHHANSEGVCFPSRKTIQEEGGVSERTVDKCLKKLIELGILIKEARKSGAKNITNEYQIIIDDGGASPAGGGAGYAPGVGHSLRTELYPYRTISTELYAPETGAGEIGETDKGKKEVNNESTDSSKTSSKTTSKDVSEVIFAFKDLNLSYHRWYANKTERNAAENLINLYGKDRVLQIIGLLPKTNVLPYFPSISSPYILEKKWFQLESAMIRMKNEKTKEANKYPIAFV